MPGVEYVKERRWAYGGPLVTHLLIAPPPGGLYGFRPVLSNERIAGRETVSAMQRRLSRRATLAGVNGDFFNFATGHPSGIFLRANRLASRSLRQRSSLGIGGDGLLRIGRIGYRGVWQVPDQSRHALNQFNRPLENKVGFTLFVPSWGARTPNLPRAREAVLSSVGPVRPNAGQTVRVERLRTGGGHAVPAGGAIIQARGRSRWTLVSEAKPGTTMTIRVGLDPWWSGVGEALGGGPLLVRDGAVVLQAGEAFSSYQLDFRHPRTALGQLADGRIILFTADKTGASRGLKNTQLAREMARLGAVNAMALDGGGSTTMAFDGRTLNRPSGGAERAVSNSLQILYYGVYAPKPRYWTFSPNGDGAYDVQRLVAKVVRRSTVDYRLVKPNGEIGWRYQATIDPGRFVKKLRSRTLPEGNWRWIVDATDNRGRHSQMERRFVLNKTLGFLSLSKDVMRVRPRRGGRIVISFRLAHRASVTVVIRRRGQTIRRLVSAQELGSGNYAVVWNGRTASGKVVSSGRFVARVRANNALGPTALERRFRVIRITG
jgi:hypothetical protein